MREAQRGHADSERPRALKLRDASRIRSRAQQNAALIRCLRRGRIVSRRSPL